MPDGQQKDANKASMTFEKYLPLYNLYREYSKRESDLINSRLSWILTIHGFLYATYGLTLQKVLETTEKLQELIYKGKNVSCPSSVGSMLGQTELFLLFIAIVGFCISLFGLLSIWAARDASHAVNHLFYSFRNKAHSLIEIEPKDLIIATDIHRKNKPKNRSSRILFWRSGYDEIKESNLSAYETLDGYIIPALRGGGDNSTISSGLFASSLIPITLAMSWILAVAILLPTYAYNRNIICLPFYSYDLYKPIYIYRGFNDNFFL